MASAKHNAYPDFLPDFRNLGVIARVLVGANLIALVAALYAEKAWPQALDHFVRGAVLLEPLLLASLVVLYVVGPLLARLPYWQGAVAVIAIEIVLAAGVHSIALAVETMFDAGTGAAPQGPGLVRTLLFTGLAAAVLLGYFRLRSKAFSPALAEARLQALQARIRPHFLFNSLNAVLSLIRRDPRRAEAALENLADLFRELMSDGREFVRLADEIALLERYAGLEHLRLGDRLRVVWEVDAAPVDALLPPLVLQPLLENAVYHGVEPGTGSGEVLVHIERRDDRVHVRISNPYLEGHAQRAGNRMALENIRERLELFFDAEARIDSRVEGGRYEVVIVMPYRIKARANAGADLRADTPTAPAHRK